MEHLINGRKLVDKMADKLTVFLHDHFLIDNWDPWKPKEIKELKERLDSDEES